MKLAKSALFLLLGLNPAYAQAPSVAQWGINKASNPYPVSINLGTSWAQMGTVSSAGVWNLPVGNVTNSTVPLLAAANTWSNLNTVATSGPVWASYSGIWDQFVSNVNSYPVSQAFGNNLVPIAGAIGGYMRIPSTASGGNANHGVAGYAVTSSTVTGALGTFGFGGIAVNGASAWGLNSVTTNGISPQPATNSGFSNGVLYGYEADFNIVRTAGGGNPNVAVRGLYFIGNSEVLTTNIATTIDIDGMQFQNPKIPWKIGLNTNDGAVTNAINLGALSVNSGSTSSASQPITFNSYLSGSPRTSTISADAFGNLIMTPQSGSGIIPVGNIYPSTDGTYTIGLSGNKFAAAYLATISANTTQAVTAAYFVNGGSAAVAYFGNQAGQYCTITPPSPTLSCVSDIRLKENVSDSKNALDYLSTFRIRDYVLKSDKSNHTGVIAQEVQFNHPDLVHKGENGYLAVDTVNTWKIIKAIQELKAKNDELSAQIASMKKNHP